MLNNPLLYNDPSGEFAFIAALLGVSKFVAAIIGGALIGVASYSVGVLVTGGKWNIGGALQSMLFGAVGGAATYGIGSLFSAAGEGGQMIATALAKSIEKSVGSFGLAMVQGGCHAISQGVLGLMQGQDFLHSAVAGFAGSLGASGWGAAFGTTGVSMIVFGALSGGVASEISGGNFCLCFSIFGEESANHCVRFGRAR